MNWLERARREIRESTRRPTAVTAERNPMAVMAVPHTVLRGELRESIGSIGSTVPAGMPESDAIRGAFEERAAIMEFDGGLSRDEAERAALALVLRRHQMH